MARTLASDEPLRGSASNIGTVGSVSVRIKPSWSSGDGSWHSIAVWWLNGDATKFLDLDKYLDNNLYVGWHDEIVISDSGLFTAGTWVNIIITWNSATPVTTIYFDNVQKGTAAAASVQTIDSIELGNAYFVANNAPLNGDIAEVASWNVVLDTAERAALAKGYSPLFIRPSALLDYWPLIGKTSPDVELLNGHNLTPNGTPAAAPHPRIIMPTRAGKLPWIPAETVSI